MSKRKLGEPAPDRMFISLGGIQMADQSNLAKYLVDWQDKNNIADGTSVCLVTKEDLESLEKRLAFLLSLTFC